MAASPASESPVSCFLGSFEESYSTLIGFSEQQNVPSPSCEFPVPDVKSALSVRSSGSCQWACHIRNQIWSVEVHVKYLAVNVPKPPDSEISNSKLIRFLKKLFLKDYIHMSLTCSEKYKFLIIAYLYIIKISFITFGLFILHAHACGR